MPFTSLIQQKEKSCNNLFFITCYVLLAVFGVSLGISCFYVMIEQSARDIQGRNHRLGIVMESALHRVINDFEVALEMMTLQMTMNLDFSYSDFSIMASPLVRQKPWSKIARALAWIPRIDPGEANAFFEWAQESYKSVPGINFNFMNKSLDAPIFQSDAVLGYNIANDTAREIVYKTALSYSQTYLVPNLISLFDNLPSMLLLKRLPQKHLAPNQTLPKPSTFVQGALYFSANMFDFINYVWGDLNELLQTSFILCDFEAENPVLFINYVLQDNSIFNSSNFDVGSQPLQGVKGWNGPPTLSCSNLCQGIPYCNLRFLHVANRKWALVLFRPLEPDYFSIISLFILIIVVTLVLIGIIRKAKQQLYLTSEMLLKETKAKELATAAKLKAEAITNYKLSFVNNMSHELKTPTNGMVLIQQLLSESAMGKDQKELFKTLTCTTEYLVSLINGLFEGQEKEDNNVCNDGEILSSPPATTSHLEIIDLEKECLQFVQRVCSIEKAASGVAMKVDSGPAPPKFLIKVDTPRLRNALIGFSQYCLRYAARNEGKEVVLSWERIQDEKQSPSEEEEERNEAGDERAVLLHFVVQHNGTYHSAECQALLQEWVRLKSNSEEVKQRLERHIRQHHSLENPSCINEEEQLMLLHCKKLAAFMGGSVEVYFPSIVCTQFNIHIKAKEVPCPTPTVPLLSSDKNERVEAESPPGFSEEKQRMMMALVVEDNEINRKMQTRLIERNGWKCETAENGLEAVEKSLVVRYDLILMDIQMPVMDGYEAVKEIRAREGPNQNTLIYALSANLAEQANAKSIKSGMDGFMCKPLQKAKLSALLQQVQNQI